MNRKKIHLMIQMALCEKKYGKDLKYVDEYYFGDYAGIHVIKNCINMTFVYLIILLGLLLKQGEDFFNKMTIQWVIRFGAFSLLGLFVVWLLTAGITYLQYYVKYYRCSKHYLRYQGLAQKLEKEYEQEQTGGKKRDTENP